MERYNIKDIEKKWQNIWSTKKTDSVVTDKSKKKFYFIMVDNHAKSLRTSNARILEVTWTTCNGTTNF